MAIYCSNCGNPCDDNQLFCPNCGNTLNQQSQPSNQLQQDTPDMPMKWFKFVIYFQLFASCVLNAISGISALKSIQFLDGLDMLGDLSVVVIADVVYGVVLLGLAVYAIVARMKLAKFSANGPKTYFTFLGAQLAVGLIYNIASIILIHAVGMADYVEFNYTSMISSAVSAAIMLACNVTYFNKRMHLFKNP